MQPLFRSIAFLLSGIAAFAAPLAACHAQGSSGKLRPADLLANPEKYLNQTVTIEVTEPLYGPSTPEALAKVEYGQVGVMIPDAGGLQLSLVPAGFKIGDPNRYKQKFSQVLSTPLKVRGEFLLDQDLSEQSKRKAYVLRVASIEPLDLGQGKKVSLSEIKANPAAYDRQPIVYEGVYRYGFEISSLDKEIWLSTRAGAEIVGKPAGKPAFNETYRIRVSGIFYSKPGAHYGHLGGYPFEILASKVEYLGVANEPIVN